MLNKLLHTPEGVRDIYNGECEKKQTVQKNMNDVLKLYGFKSIQTPTFEFFDIFNAERGSVPSKEMFKFFDHEGNTLVLRPDITPSVARCVAKYYQNEHFPIRLSYTGNTFINNISYQGKLKENTQLGAELFNDETSDADAEMIAICIDCLLKAGLKDFQIEVGQVDFFNGLMQEAKLEADEIEEFKVLVQNKNLFGASELLSTKNIDEEIKEKILELPKLFGSFEILDYAKTLTNGNKKALKAIERLEKVYKILDTYGFSKYISFDLGMLSQYTYYTGIIFKAYTYDTGDAIASGGRYDKLMAQFGKKAAAIGLVIMVDQLLIAMNRQEIDIPIETHSTLVVYVSERRNDAISFANEYRAKGKKLELLRKSSKRPIDEYLELAKRRKITEVIYIDNKNKMTAINVKKGTSKEL